MNWKVKARSSAIKLAESIISEAAFGLDEAITTVINVVGPTLTQVYDNNLMMLKNMARNNPEIPGFAVVSAGAFAKWVDTVFFDQVLGDLYTINRHIPQLYSVFSNMTETEYNADGARPKMKYGNIEEYLPDYLRRVAIIADSEKLMEFVRVLKRMTQNYKEVVAKYNEAAAKYKAERKAYDAEHKPQNVARAKANAEAAARDEAAAKARTEQRMQVEKIVQGVLNSLPSRVAGEIRNEIARSPNKLVALQQALTSRNIKLGESKKKSNAARYL